MRTESGEAREWAISSPRPGRSLTYLPVAGWIQVFCSKPLAGLAACVGMIRAHVLPAFCASRHGDVTWSRTNIGRKYGRARRAHSWLCHENSFSNRLEISGPTSGLGIRICSSVRIYTRILWSPPVINPVIGAGPVDVRRDRRYLTTIGPQGALSQIWPSCRLGLQPLCLGDAGTGAVLSRCHRNP